MGVASQRMPPPMIVMSEVWLTAGRIPASAALGQTMLDSRAMDLEFLMVPGAPPPPPTAPYSHAVRAGDYLFVTGQLGADPKTGDRLVPGGIGGQKDSRQGKLQRVTTAAVTTPQQPSFS